MNPCWTFSGRLMDTIPNCSNSGEEAMSPDPVIFRVGSKPGNYFCSSVRA
jgi:hypothetical protein